MSVTSPLSDPSPEAALVAGAPLFRLSSEKYRAMVRDGILTEDDPFEYLQGVLVEKMTKSDRHVAVVWFLRRLIERLLASGFFTLSQDPIDLRESEPEPDLVIVRGTPEDLFDRKPTAAEIAVVFEVSDTTLRRDRELKRAVYAAAGIATYWIVNLVDNVLEIYSDLDAGGFPADYRGVQRLTAADQAALTIDGVTHDIPVRDILGP